jgi:arylamine N-acetyltransferase
MSSLFTDAEIDAYLEYIQLPSEYRTSSTLPRDISFLTKLHIHNISHVPYENLPLHYSEARIIDVNPRAVYNKIMTKRGRGGQCMELNCLLTYIIRGLGFKVYPTGARVRPRVNGVPSGAYTGW